MKRNMIWIRRKGLDLGIFPAAGAIAPGLQVLFHSRRGGSSAGPFASLNMGMNVGDRRESVLSNRELLLGAAGIAGDRLARAEQVHGARVAVARGGALHEGTDGLVTDERDLALCISTADCYPVVIYAPSERVLAALHVGRNGAAEGIIERAADMMRGSFRIGTEGTVALIGPGICAGCYEVGEKEAERFPARFRSGRGARCRLDLLSFCREELRRCGLRSDRIFEAGYCTSCNPRLFYSYRRDGKITGRHWTLARMLGARRPR
ncbi:MAG TPA: laccase domain-containing protein [Candidatus Eisenbacteria bacterium]|uniref:Laccase domain-containing protein n=1 Tax=Eiseniibacteriota bacterium TaxID=2212470 RepID=A0A7V2F4D1_UNCEI|nr:laccase domain-containing protein [Candidatus Eisenbacteria bacterium]